MTVTNERLNGNRTNPFPMKDPLFVPRERYYDREFFELEKEHLWRRTWQMACRLEEIPEVGDFTEYVICDQSIIVVREREDRIRAFYNACRHRATELLKGSGSLLGGQIVCPFHGWRWNSDGSSSFVYGAEAFAAECLKPDDIKLQECLSDVWGGCVWINLDPEAAPLQEMLAPAAAILDPLALADMKVWWWKEVVLDVNWKMAMEAFLEGYHTMRTHTQLTMGAGEDWPAGSILYDTFEHGHSRFWMKPSDEPMSAEMFIEFARVLWEGQDAMTLERDVRVFEGIRNRPDAQENAAPVAIAALYEYSAGAGIPLPQLTPEQMGQWGGEVFLFPNFFVLPQYGNALSYRCRPYGDDPEKCLFEVWSLTLYPEGHDPGRASLMGRFAQDDEELGPDPEAGLQQHGAAAEGTPLGQLQGVAAGDGVGRRHHQLAPRGRPLHRRLAVGGSPGSSPDSCRTRKHPPPNRRTRSTSNPVGPISTCARASRSSRRHGVRVTSGRPPAGGRQNAVPAPWRSSRAANSSPPWNPWRTPGCARCLSATVRGVAWRARRVLSPSAPSPSANRGYG